MVNLVERLAERVYNGLPEYLKRRAGAEEIKRRNNDPTHQEQINVKRDREEQARLRKKAEAKSKWKILMQGTGDKHKGGKRKGGKPKGTKRKGTKRRGTKRKGTKRKGTKRKGTKRRGSKCKTN